MALSDYATNELLHEFERLNFCIAQVQLSLKYMKCVHKASDQPKSEISKHFNEYHELKESQCDTKTAKSCELKLISKVDNALAKATQLMNMKQIDATSSVKKSMKLPNGSKLNNAKQKFKNVRPTEVIASKQKSIQGKISEVNHNEKVDNKSNSQEKFHKRRQKIHQKYAKLARCTSDMQKESSRFKDSIHSMTEYLVDENSMDPENDKLVCIYKILHHIDVSYISQGTLIASNVKEIVKKSNAEFAQQISDPKAVSIAHALRKSHFIAKKFSKQSIDQQLSIVAFNKRENLLNWFDEKINLFSSRYKVHLLKAIVQGLESPYNESKYQTVQLAKHLLSDKMFIPAIPYHDQKDSHQAQIKC